jgi:dihydropyrimidinase
VTVEGQSDVDVRVRDGVITEIGSGLAPGGERVIDAGNMLVLPGGIDPHAHLTQAEGTPEQYLFADHLASGSEAALAGGITTIGNMTYPGQGVTLQEGIARDERFVRESAICDIMLHPVLVDPSDLDEAGIRTLAEAGHTSIKIFMVIESFDRNLTDFVRVMRQAGEAGLMSVVHCEDPAIIAEATRDLVEAGKSSLRHYADSRPLLSETIATRRAIAYCETTGAPIYVVHLSAAEPLDICREAQERGLPVPGTGGAVVRGPAAVARGVGCRGALERSGRRVDPHARLGYRRLEPRTEARPIARCRRPATGRSQLAGDVSGTLLRGRREGSALAGALRRALLG